MTKLLVLIPIIFLSACADISYYWHSTKGHLSIMNKRVEISTMLEDPAIDNELKSRLRLVQEIRAYSIEVLNLPKSGSYTNYVNLDRPYVLQNLFAAPEFSTRLLSWCYPIVGCASYRGYYEEKLLSEFVSDLKLEENVDIYVGKVPAYSTLGWFDDPILSSFIDWPDYRLAGLLFHELTHQRLYIDGDTQFNESLASAIQQVGTELWLKSKEKTTELEQFQRWIVYRQQVVSLIELTREELAQLYKTEIAEDLKRHKKQTLLNQARNNHTSIAESLNFKGGFTHWFATDLNNAKLASVSAYNAYIPAFLNMMKAHKNNFNQFFYYVETIGDLEQSKRSACLEAWQQGTAIDNDKCH